MSRVEGERRHILPDGRLVTLSRSAAFVRHGQRLAGRADPLLTDVRIGRGRALVLGDADLIDDRLWLADPARPLDPRRWSADTPALIANWLGADLPMDRRWMRAVGDVAQAIRWALLVGTGWAAFAILFTRLRQNRNKA